MRHLKSIATYIRRLRAIQNMRHPKSQYAYKQHDASYSVHNYHSY